MTLPVEPVAVEFDVAVDPPVVDPPAAPKSAEAETPVEGQVYVWYDGDRTQRVRLQSDLTVQTSADGRSEIVEKSSVSGGTQSQGQALPVFRSESSGEMMTLPGGVFMLFESEYGATEINRFFTEQGISRDRVTPALLDNAFEIETAPGFDALELANRLAGQPGVEFAIPNWTFETVTK